MILVDYSSAMISRIVHNKAKIDENMIRHVCLDRILSIRKQFGTKYGELVICQDGTNYWRKQVFPFYKGRRKEALEKSPLDWSLIMNTIRKFATELHGFFPYRVIRVDHTEADDIIGVLTKKFHTNEKIMIYSGDHDFCQLLKYTNVEQYSPITKKFIKVSNPEIYLKEKIIRGDSGDGIPNILSNDNTFMIPDGRQTPIRSSKLNTWLKESPETFCENETILRNWHRNRMLIDLENTPKDIENEILEQYENYDISNWKRENILSYLSMTGTMVFLENIQDF